MPAVEREFGSRKYLNIVGGRLVEQVEEGTPGAVSRVNKLGRTVFEKSYDAWGGIVKDWIIEDGEYGKSLKVSFDDARITFSGKMMTEFIKKFAAAKQDSPITVSPYPDFVKNGQPVKSGLSLIQNSARLYSHFSDYKDGVFTEKNGFPKAPARWDAMTEEQKAIYNIQVNSFLENYVTTHPINNIGAGSANAPKEEEIPTVNLDDDPTDAKKQLDEIPW